MGVVFENETFAGATRVQTVDEHIVRKVRRLSEFFCELSIKSWKMQVFPPTLVAVSCIIGARMVAQIQPLWGESMQQLTRLEFDLDKHSELAQCFEKMFQHYDLKFKLGESKQSADRGTFLRDKKSVLSTCEPTPLTAGFDNFSNAKKHILESNQNLMNDSFVKSSQKDLNKQNFDDL